jgi:GxxExxY protein
MTFYPHEKFDLPIYIEKIASHVSDSAYRIHTEHGPGMLEKSYELCLFHDMKDLGYEVETQVSLSIYHHDHKQEGAYRIDMLINNCLVIEIKSIESIQLIHKKQLLTYLKAGGYRLGILINVNCSSLQDGIKRVVNWM